MFAKLIEHKMKQINKLYGNHNRIECVNLYDKYYSIEWNYNGHKRRTKYKGTEYECYQFLRAFLLERRVKVYALPIYHSAPIKWIRENFKIGKSEKEFMLDFVAVTVILGAIFSLAFLL